MDPCIQEYKVSNKIREKFVYFPLYGNYCNCNENCNE